ncbi:Serine proteases trypsin domain [Trinorchestia longiramus]|nr:Serine proteases trypsin domain [Trinorchestia longiramus]
MAVILLFFPLLFLLSCSVSTAFGGSIRNGLEVNATIDDAERSLYTSHRDFYPTSHVQNGNIFEKLGNIFDEDERGRAEQRSFLRRTIRGNVQPLRWITDRRGRIFGELPDVSRPLSQLRNQTTMMMLPRSDRITNGLPCNGVTTLSPDGENLAFVLPVKLDSTLCQAVIFPTEGSSLTLECPFFSFAGCQKEYFYVTDGADRKHLYCGNQILDQQKNMKQLFLLYEKKMQGDSSVNAFCTVSATYDVPPTQDEPAPVDSYQICPSSCGKAVSNSGIVRIIGGSLADEGEYPWMVKLDIKMKNGNGFQCGGSIINSRNILTAAHCLEDEQNIQSIGVTVGRIGASSSVNEQRIVAVDWFVHQQYSQQSKKMDADIAIVYLPHDLRLGAVPFDAAPVCLAPPAQYEHQVAVVTGWGVTSPSEGGVSPHLLEAGVTVTKQSECHEAYSVFGHSISEKQVCAAEVGRDSCQGDSGGPLVTQLKGLWYQLGVVSFGIGCADPQFPGVYTLVPAFRDWIAENLKGGTC